MKTIDSTIRTQNISLNESEFSNMVQTGLYTCVDNMTLYFTSKEVEDISWGNIVKKFEYGINFQIFLQKIGVDIIHKIIYKKANLLL